MKSISDLENANRVEIFRHLAVDELNEIEVEVLDSLAAKCYQDFLKFCDEVYSKKNYIQSISCVIEDGELDFTIIYQK